MSEEININSSENIENAKSKKSNPKRIVAWVCLIVLPLLYIVTLILALTGYSIYNGLLTTCIIATIGLPIFAYIIIWLIGRSQNQKIIGDPEDNK